MPTLQKSGYRPRLKEGKVVTDGTRAGRDLKVATKPDSRLTTQSSTVQTTTMAAAGEQQAQRARHPNEPPGPDGPDRAPRLPPIPMSEGAACPAHV